jgi:hypothetical protein
MMALKHFEFVISVDDGDESWSTEAASLTQAVFLTGVVFGQTNPELILNGHKITIKEK